ncbi:chorismate pyruvate-lyase family protein [Cohnella faecalis]|uniref:DUF98 domain-containing protein n=1 Tax=Cohnella faecalis TaxID=2315694 RepID=A0A398CR11_9BACL|nr:chorismate pyruvate-lyase family protein [Cohnella faecalis]RIE04973.1 DUF98 domain-containing protein [Cohnella faecalis]
MLRTSTDGAVVRMLLRSDGSTTLLLESLLDRKLTVEVTGQYLASREEIHPDILAHLQTESTDRLYIRRSALQTDERIKVSFNYLVMRVPLGQENLYETLCTRDIPLGKQIANNRIEHHRHLIGDGRIEQEIDGRKRVCYFKHYLLELSREPIFYIHESFHPDYLPVEDTFAIRG